MRHWLNCKRWYIAGKSQTAPKEKCIFSLGMGKKTAQCQEYGTSLIETGACSVHIVLMQPVGQASCDTAVYKRGDILRGLPREQNTICFAYFQVILNHLPPPPPVSAFARNNIIFAESHNSRGAPQPTSNWRFRRNQCIAWELEVPWFL